MSAVSISDPDQLAITTIRTLCMDAAPEAVVGLAKERVERSTAG